MVRPIQENRVPERLPPPINGGASLVARRITALALSAIAAVVTFIACESALIATLTGVALYALLSLPSEDSGVNYAPRPVRWYGYLNPIRYFPTWTWHRTTVIHQQAQRRDYARPAEVVHRVPVLQGGPRVEVGHGHRSPPPPPRMGQGTTYAEVALRGPRYSPPRPDARPAEVVHGVPVLQGGDRAEVGGGHTRGPANILASMGREPLAHSAAFGPYPQASRSPQRNHPAVPPLPIRSQASAARPPVGAPAGAARVPVGRGHRN